MALPDAGAALVFGIAGLGLFLMLLNRRLIMIRDSRFKGAIIATTGIVMSLAPALLALNLPERIWAIVPAAIVILLLIGECRRFVIRRRCMGVLPVVSAAPTSGPLTTTALRVARYELRDLPWEGPAFRIVQISDLHVTSLLPFSYFEEVMTRVDALEPDVLVITGDLVTDVACTPLLRRMLRPVGRVGTFAILGNHDYWAGAELVAEAVSSAGIDLLRDGTRRVRLGARHIVLSGCEYPWSRQAWQRPHVGPGELLIVLSHTPDNVYELSRGAAHLVFSGHFHAGQIRVPHVGSLVVPSVYGRRFDHGHFIVGGTNLFVTAGIGAADPPVRLYCPPDIFVVDIFPAPRPAVTTDADRSAHIAFSC